GYRWCRRRLLRGTRPWPVVPRRPRGFDLPAVPCPRQRHRSIRTRTLAVDHDRLTRHRRLTRRYDHGRPAAILGEGFGAQRERDQPSVREPRDTARLVAEDLVLERRVGREPRVAV